MAQRKRQRTASMIKLLNQKREAKLWYEEANSHVKNGNLDKAIYSYRKSFADRRLSITREAEIFQSFVRTNANARALETLEEEPLVLLAEELKETKKEEEPGQESISPEATQKLSEQLSQEVKKKRRKRKKNGRNEEIYCDKDRAAAVNLGSKDIKQSLRLKRKQDRSKFLQIPEEAEPGTFLALGNYEMCRGDLRIAIDFISKALELNPAEKNALVARSKCYILLGQPDNALKDAETALQVDRHFMKAIYQKAEAMYYLGEFEQSLVFFHRGLHIRPDHEKFKLGVHKAQKAIENAIGSSFSDLLRSRAASISNVSEKSSASVESVSEVTSKKSEHINPTAKSANRTTPQGTNKSLKKSRLLRELAPDKDYLDNLMHNPNIKCKYKGNDSTVEKYIKETVEYLNARQEFWRQQLPANLK